MTPLQIAAALVLGPGVAALAWRAGALTTSGAVAAGLLGAVIFGGGGFPWAALLIAFFLSSSLLSRFFSARKGEIQDTFAKGSRRDWSQVAANGGLAGLLVIIQAWAPESFWPWVAFAGAMAAVNADTWATELGVLSPAAPRLITTGRQVERGVSGAVSASGILASLAGAALIAVLASALSAHDYPAPRMLLAVTTGGVAGSLFDSFLGATVQVMYRCQACLRDTERHPVHTCGGGTQRQRGWSWMNNDTVNLFASLLGAGLAWILI